jgi:hypothetical protein
MPQQVLKRRPPNYWVVVGVHAAASACAFSICVGVIVEAIKSRPLAALESP